MFGDTDGVSMARGTLFVVDPDSKDKSTQLNVWPEVVDDLQRFAAYMEDCAGKYILVQGFGYRAVNTSR